MRSSRFLLALLGAALVHAGAHAADPVVVEVLERSTAGTSIVTVGDVAVVSGGDADARVRVARLDLADLKPREQNVVIGRRSVEYRIQLAGTDAVRVVGAERSTVTVVRRTVTVDEVVAVARAELFRHSADTPGLAIELAQPLVVKLPEIPRDERISITAKPRARAGATGRVQMDMTIASSTGETLLAFAIQLDARSNAHPGAGAVTRAGGTGASVSSMPGAAVLPASAVGTAPTNEVLVRSRQRVEVQVQNGDLKVVMVGEAQQDGRLGQTVFVQNLDSKKLVPAKVVGPGKLEIELGGKSP
ncbi:flagellar basal body P-ring biosynthesis protein FlgA [Gemmata sp. SH-PL17]|uniref:flagella basal body P-ring formation protein FlgA n=1 Tax=Gemmata sp. SH-PL17 TaxID=1630693 RepID=UPI00078E9794|nr:flagella basal body P-ring formation protein FlgA [Gemmata sp. SH-PL17]AMV25017.1 flagellar basal body P-ring biosynthesis protein FlgA [Gemmata sp. SH-PL17]